MTRRQDAQKDTKEDGSTGMMGELVAGLNHEIRTSMNGVAGLLALLLDSGLSAEQRQLATDAQHCAEQLTALLENIVDLSIIDAGKFELAETFFDLPAMLQAASAAPAAAAREKGLALQLHFPSTLRLQGDAARLQQIIGSLLNAAVCLTVHGQLSVDSEVLCGDAGPCRVRLTVSGLAPVAAQQLLDMLNQADEAKLAAARIHDRIGLELALSKRLARLMNAQIEVRRQPEAQSCLSFSVELERATSVLSGVRILLLAQDGANNEELASWLRAEGMRIESFYTVTAALAALANAVSERDPYRIAILGSAIQSMDCEVLGAAIMADPAYRELRLVALSAWPRHDNNSGLVQAGFSAAIATPVQQTQALAVLTALCETLASGRVPHFIAPDSDGRQQGSAPPFSGRRILVADDNPVNRKVAQRMAENLGCVVEVAVDGEQAIAMHAAHPYDLILMDCQMPRLDGYQATERIRALEGAVTHTPIIAVTACAAQGERDNCLAKGMDDFVAKPVRPRILREVLARWLPGPARAHSSEAASYADELNVVRDMFGADFAELARLYQNDGRPRLDALRSAGASRDWVQVAKVAHAFSGSSVSIGATGLSALCKELERQAKSGEPDDFVEQLATVEAEYNRISSKLQAMIQSDVGAS